jgi:hypothetical protein
MLAETGQLPPRCLSDDEPELDKPFTCARGGAPISPALPILLY